jgi:dUTP pyrophosphatase
MVHFLLKCLKNNESFYNEEENTRFDSGLDLYFPESYTVPANARSFKLPLGVAMQKSDNNISGYYLYPRSSIVKTPLILANSVGIIDYGYRGEITAVVHNLSDKDFFLKSGTSLFQICNPDLSPVTYNLVTELSYTERGEGGFGSTNK